jgi:DNA-binding MarR family transcriptional regulator
MDWQAFGFKDDPLNTSPITKATLELFTGHSEEIKVCMNVLTGSNVRIIIEGARGVGTTSFSNYLRFKSEVKKLYFTPRTEIKVEKGWRSETVLASIISNFVREIELRAEFDKLVKDKRFQSAKSISSRIAETYRSFCIDAFGFGANYGKQSGIVTQPLIVPSSVLGHSLEDLIAFVKEAGYKKGTLFQINNLDIGEIHSPEEMKYLFNALRDYTQMEGSNWLFVGDVGLRRFIAQEVDRLDDIISYEVNINPLPLFDLSEMIMKRVKFYSESEKAGLPIDKEVFNYLYKMTSGRLRYVFGLASRLMNRLYIGDLTDKVTLDIAKPMLMKLGRDRVQRSDLLKIEKQALKLLVTTPNATPSKIAKELKKTAQYVGRVLSSLVDKGLASSKKEKKERIYIPSIDAVIAFTKID